MKVRFFFFFAFAFFGMSYTQTQWEHGARYDDVDNGYSENSIPKRTTDKGDTTEHTLTFFCLSVCSWWWSLSIYLVFLLLWLYNPFILASIMIIVYNAIAWSIALIAFQSKQ